MANQTIIKTRNTYANSCMQTDEMYIFDLRGFLNSFSTNSNDEMKAIINAVELNLYTINNSIEFRICKIERILNSNVFNYTLNYNETQSNNFFRTLSLDFLLFSSKNTASNKLYSFLKNKIDNAEQLKAELIYDLSCPFLNNIYSGAEMNINSTQLDTISQKLDALATSFEAFKTNFVKFDTDFVDATFEVNNVQRNSLLRYLYEMLAQQKTAVQGCNSKLADLTRALHLEENLNNSNITDVINQKSSDSSSSSPTITNNIDVYPLIEANVDVPFEVKLLNKKEE